MAERIGQKFGNYRLTRFLGQGGFAAVYLAEHIHLHTPAAIKVLTTQLSSQEVAQFRHEAYLLARFNHPNIIRMLDFGLEETAQLPFLVMQYAAHGTLRQRHIKGSSIPLNAIRFYVKSVSAALQYAHDHHIIHRDVKPENMLIGDQNEILLSDFGIALLSQNTLNSFQQETQGALSGTAYYMAPEQIQGKARPASDQYALAIVVYEWLCGDRPFQGSFAEVCSQQLVSQPQPLREKLPTISPEVEQVVMKALAKDPKERFGSIQAFATAFEEAGEGRTTARDIGSVFAPVPSERIEYQEQALANRPGGSLQPGGLHSSPSPHNALTTYQDDSPPKLAATARPTSKPRSLLMGGLILALLLILVGSTTFAIVTQANNAHISAAATATSRLATSTAVARIATSTATAQLVAATATTTAQLTSSADFTTQAPALKNMTVVANDSAFDTNHSVLFSNQQVIVTFPLQPHVTTVTLSLRALVSQNGPNTPGSSPITIYCNNQVVVSNYMMPGNGYSANTTSIQIPIQQLTQGSNQLRLVVAPDAQTAFWLYNLSVAQSF
jgi:serine/threonine protein kinase